MSTLYKEVIVVSPFQKQGNWGTEVSVNLPKVTEHAVGPELDAPSSSSEPVFLNINSFDFS